MEWLFIWFFIAFPNLAVLLGMYYIYVVFLKNHEEPIKNKKNLKIAFFIIAGLVVMHLLATILYKTVKYLFL